MFTGLGVDVAFIGVFVTDASVVLTGVCVGVAVFVGVAVRVAVFVGVAVRVAVFVGVAVRVAVFVGVAVADPAPNPSVTASSTLIRGKTRLLRESVIDVPASVSHWRIWLTDALGAACFITAQAPATWGVAMEVPALYEYEVVDDDVAERIKKPGANKSSNLSPLPFALLFALVGAFEKYAT